MPVYKNADKYLNEFCVANGLGHAFYQVDLVPHGGEYLYICTCKIGAAKCTASFCGSVDEAIDKAAFFLLDYLKTSPRVFNSAQMCCDEID